MKTIHPLDLAAKIEANETIEILDLRTRSQFQKRHIRGAHVLPFDEFNVASLLECRELPVTEPLYLISQKSGYARLVSDAMEDCGLRNLFIVDGGMENWEQNGLPVTRHDFGVCLYEHCNRMFCTGMATDLAALGARP
jgi:rhodanese-related sulfurtransferase